MSVNISNIISLHDKFIADASNDSITAADRLSSATEAVAWVKEQMGTQFEDRTYTFNFLDTVHRYDVTTALADFYDAVDVRRLEADHDEVFKRKSPREIMEEIGQGFADASFSTERYDNKLYLICNLESKYAAKELTDFDSITADGTWTADTTNSDATNVTLDTVEYLWGTGSLNLDIDVSQSANDRATIYNDSFADVDLTDYEDLSSWLLDVYIPDVTNFSSVTLYWGSDSSNYWSATSTTDYNGNAFVAGWNLVKFNWSGATQTLSPDVTSIGYIRIDLNYTNSQADDTDFRLDYLRLVRPEPLKFIYQSQNVGTSSGGTRLTAFTATTDIPYFSGQYDNLKIPVAHMMASLSFDQLRLKDEAMKEEARAFAALDRIRKANPSNKLPQTKTFKTGQISFTRKKWG